MGMVRSSPRGAKPKSEDWTTEMTVSDERDGVKTTNSGVGDAAAGKLTRYYDRPGLRDPSGPLAHPDEQARADLICREIAALSITRILEVGAGSGIIANRLHSAGFDVTASDVSATALQWVRGPAVLAGIDNLPFGNRTFDLVVASEVLEHIPPPVLASGVGEMQRVARTWILLTVPNGEDLVAAAIVCPECRCRFHPSRHLTEFDRHRLATLFPDFDVVKVYPFGPILRPRGRVEMVIRRDLLQRIRDWAPGSICPQCGYEQSDLPSASMYGPRARLGVAARLLRPLRRPRPRWLLALYKRRQGT